MIDLLLVTAPVRPLSYPPMSLALLKSVVENKGFTCKTIDYNQQYYAECGFDQDTHHTKTKKWDNHLPVSYREVADSECGQWITDQVLKDIQKHAPKTVGISAFSYFNNIGTYHLCKVIRKHFPATKIIVGGYGINKAFNFLKEFDDELQHRSKFADILKDHNLIDTYIIGDGEEALVEWLTNNSADFTDSMQNIQSLQSIPYADYHDLDIKNYAYTKNLTLPMTGSKGCVRQCTFCDVPGKFGKFKYRPGKDLAQEVIHLYETYGANTIYLTDSLTNGSLKAFLDYIEELANLKHKKGYSDLEWTGQYIIRPKHQIPNPNNYYSLLHNSGAVGLSAGAESGSDAVLDHMKKKCKAEDILCEVENFSKYKISCVLLFFPGYPTETRKDFIDTIKLLKKLQPFWCDGTIEEISLGDFFTYDTSSWWGNMKEEQGMFADSEDMHLWWYDKNPDLDYKELVFRRLVLAKIAEKLSMPVLKEHWDMSEIHDYFTSNIEKIKHFHADIR